MFSVLAFLNDFKLWMSNIFHSVLRSAVCMSDKPEESMTTYLRIYVIYMPREVFFKVMTKIPCFLICLFF